MAQRRESCNHRRSRLVLLGNDLADLVLQRPGPLVRVCAAFGQLLDLLAPLLAQLLQLEVQGLGPVLLLLEEVGLDAEPVVEARDLVVPLLDLERRLVGEGHQLPPSLCQLAPMERLLRHGVLPPLPLLGQGREEQAAVVCLLQGLRLVREAQGDQDGLTRRTNHGPQQLGDRRLARGHGWQGAIGGRRPGIAALEGGRGKAGLVPGVALSL